MAETVTAPTDNSAPRNIEARLHPLFVSAMAGDSKAYRELLSEIGRLAPRIIGRKITSQADNEDVTQEVLLSVHKALSTYDPARPCMPWLASIIHFRINDWLRKRYSASGQSYVPIEEVQDFLECHVTREPLEYEYVNRAVAELSDSQQKVLHAMYTEELTVVEAGEKLGMSTSAVKVTAHRAYKKLREKIEE